MIPNQNKNDITIIRQPSMTYDMTNPNRAIDQLDAMRQAVYLMLNIERYDNAIYSWNYGIELDNLIGKSKSYVYPEVERRIKEALLQDDRILTVRDFEFDSKGSAVTVRFTVNTLYGGFESEMTINV